MTENEKQFHDSFKKLKGAVKSQMFGKPCYKINGKAFACLFDSEMVFKLTGNDHKEAIGLKGAKLFDPSGTGRAMKEWVQVPSIHKEKWIVLAKLAMDYVNNQK